MVKFNEQFPNNENNKEREGDENNEITNEEIDDRYENNSENTNEKIEVESQDPDLGILSEGEISKIKEQFKVALEKQVSKLRQKKIKREIEEITEKKEGE